MSRIQGKVAQFSMEWESPPRGQSGTARVRVGGGEFEDVSWTSDGQGLWLETSFGVFGYDLIAEADDEGRLLYRALERGSDRACAPVKFMRSGEAAAQSGIAAKPKAARVRAQMPGKIVRVLVKTGDSVEKDQPLLVMEAMKMENQIRAPSAGVVSKVHVSEGQAVETGAELAEIGK